MAQSWIKWHILPPEPGEFDFYGPPDQARSDTMSDEPISIQPRADYVPAKKPSAIEPEMRVAETIGSAAIDAAGGFLAALLAIYMNADADFSASMIKEAAWASMLLTSLMQFIKSYQSINTRRALSKLRSK